MYENVNFAIKMRIIIFHTDLAAQRTLVHVCVCAWIGMPNIKFRGTFENQFGMVLKSCSRKIVGIFSKWDDASILFTC